MADDLTLKQKLFAESYIGPAAGNATKAARLAGYQGDATTLQSTGSALLKKPAIAARVEQRIQEAMMSADECMAEISAIARQPLHETVKVKRNGRDEVLDAHLDPMAKLRALELVGNFHALFRNRVDVTTTEEVVRVLEYINPHTPKQLEATITTGEEKAKDR